MKKAFLVVLTVFLVGAGGVIVFISCGGGGGGGGPVCTDSDQDGYYAEEGCEDEAMCTARTQARISLQVPTGVDYDLYIIGGNACDPSSCYSSAYGDVDESVEVWANETMFDNDFTIGIEVRLYNACGTTLPTPSWTLVVEKTICNQGTGPYRRAVRRSPPLREGPILS